MNVVSRGNSRFYTDGFFFFMFFSFISARSFFQRIGTVGEKLWNERENRTIEFYVAKGINIFFRFQPAFFFFLIFPLFSTRLQKQLIQIKFSIYFIVFPRSSR